MSQAFRRTKIDPKNPVYFVVAARKSKLLRRRKSGLGDAARPKSLIVRLPESKLFCRPTIFSTKTNELAQAPPGGFSAVSRLGHIWGTPCATFRPSEKIVEDRLSRLSQVVSPCILQSHLSRRHRSGPGWLTLRQSAGVLLRHLAGVPMTTTNLHILSLAAEQPA